MSVSQQQPVAAVDRAVRAPGPESESREGTSVLAVLGRLTWMLFGPFVAVLTLISLLTRKPVGLASLDGIYFCALGAMLVGRYVEFRNGRAVTGTGTLATHEDLRRYLWVAGTVGAFLWLAVMLMRSVRLTP